MGIDHPYYPQGKEVPTGALLYNSRRVDYFGSLFTNLPIGEKVNQSQLMKISHRVPFCGIYSSCFRYALGYEWEPPIPSRHIDNEHLIGSLNFPSKIWEISW